MRTLLIGAACLGVWLGASPSLAQSIGDTATKPEVDSPNMESKAPPPRATQPVPAASANAPPDAIVEEQERRDREEQAERDRDDQA